MLKRLLLLAIVAVSMMNSCRKSDRNNDKDTQSAKDYLQAQTYFLSLTRTAIDYIQTRPEIAWNADTANHYTGTCPAVTITPSYPDSITYPKTIVLDYGANNCAGADGFSRRGKLTITVSSDPTFPGSVITIVPGKFYLNDKEVKGTVSLKRDANSSTGTRMYTETVTDGQLVLSETQKNFFEADFEREWLKGDTTVTANDDEFKINGAGTGIGTRGSNYTYTIETPLSLQPNCRFVQSAIVKLKPGNLSERVIDFGSGCDAGAKVTIFAESFDISAE